MTQGKQAKLSDSQSRKDLDSFFDELSRPEDVGAHAHDVGDKYDKLSSPKSIQLKQEVSCLFGVRGVACGVCAQCQARQLTLAAASWLVRVPEASRQPRCLGLFERLLVLKEARQHHEHLQHHHH